MIANTQAFVRLKEEQSRLINFAVLVCQSVPTLKKSIKGLEEKVPNYERLPAADYFKGIQVPLLKEYVKAYKNSLTKHLILSAFSFYESYIKSVIDELIQFQGGKESFIHRSMNKTKSFMLASDIVIEESKTKLNEYPKKGKHQKYEKHVAILEKRNDFRFPSELLATYGVKYLIEFTQSSAFTSNQIPDMLEYAFHFDLSPKVNKHPELKDKNLRETIEYLRITRNVIAHGDSVNMGFEKCMDLIRFFRYLTSNFDKHLVKNFFILEK